MGCVFSSSLCACHRKPGFKFFCASCVRKGKQPHETTPKRINAYRIGKEVVKNVAADVRAIHQHDSSYHKDEKLAVCSVCRCRVVGRAAVLSVSFRRCRRSSWNNILLSDRSAKAKPQPQRQPQPQTLLRRRSVQAPAIVLLLDIRPRVGEGQTGGRQAGVEPGRCR